MTLANHTLLTTDPGNPVFPDIADELRRQGQWHEALLVCLHGLTSNPEFARGRLMLARLFYEKGFIPFALRELSLIQKSHPLNESLRRLLEKISPGSGSFVSQEVLHGSGEQVVSETEFDIDAIEFDDDTGK